MAKRDDAAGRGSGSPGPAGADAVELSVVIAARRATVWRCVTQDDLLARWLSADVKLDPKVGGAVRIDFTRHATVVAGKVEELRPNELLVFSWGVEKGAQAASMPVGSTRIRIRLEDAEGGTRVTLRHEGLPTAKEVQDHSFGWTYYLGGLGAVAALANVEGGVEALWDRWFEAWGVTDAARRDALLGTVIEETGTYADEHAETAGRAALSQWMAMCQAKFPGVTVVRNGPVLATRGRVVCEWDVKLPDGKVMGRGINRALLGADGKLAAVEAFWRP
jgi:uncharacterized protein YndB with AHSA1/START domain